MILDMDALPQNILCETSTVADGNMSFCSGRNGDVIESRRQFLNKNKVASSHYLPIHCDHGETIRAVTRTDAVEVGGHSGVTAEVVATQTKNLPLFLLTADCQPMCFFDPCTETIALAHVSRVTLGKKLPQKVVSFLTEHFGVHPENVLVYIGPHIRKESYSFPLPLETVDSLLTPHIYVQDGQAHIDLLGASTQALTQSGIKPQNIVVSEIDTATSDNYFSYYRAKKENSDTAKRIATVLMMH